MNQLHEKEFIFFSSHFLKKNLRFVFAQVYFWNVEFTSSVRPSGQDRMAQTQLCRKDLLKKIFKVLNMSNSTVLSNV